MSWWTEARFGLFIHWGLYALPARHEWARSREMITDAVYRAYFDRFDPDLYDPCAWAREAKRAGMRYFVVTAKHHDGFCLWDSRFTDYKAPNTPAGRDLIKPLIEAMRAEGLGAPQNTLLTYHPDTKRLYVHVLEWPMGVLHLDGFSGRVAYAQLLHDASEVLFTEKGDESGFLPGQRAEASGRAVTLKLPVRKPDIEVPVIELFLK